MSARELDRLEVVRRILEPSLTQRKAAELMGLCERQVRRLVIAFEERGPAGLASGKRGRPSNRQLPPELKVNNDGVIVGVAVPISGSAEQGFILSDGKYTFFSWAGWDNTEPRGIGPQGLVVGWAFSADMSQSADFVYDTGSGAFTDITPPNTGYPSIVQGINRAGAIINANGDNVGFVGSDTWGYEYLTAPGGEVPGNSTFCTGINNLAQVGCSVGPSDFSSTIKLYIGSPQGSDADEDHRDH